MHLIGGFSDRGSECGGGFVGVGVVANGKGMGRDGVGLGWDWGCDGDVWVCGWLVEMRGRGWGWRCFGRVIRRC